MRVWRWLTATFVLLLAAAGPAATVLAQAKPEKVTIGFQVIPNQEIIAKGLGWHERALGVPVEWRQFETGREVNTAMAAGSIDLGLVGSSPAAAGISAGVPYEVIWIYDVIGDNEALVVKKGRGIGRIEDLVGKKVGVPFGATTHYHLLIALRESGVDPRRVTILDLLPPDMLAAWTRGDIDAGFVWEPTLIRMVESGGEVILSSRRLAEQGFLTADVGVVRKAFAEQYPELVATYLATLSRAVDFFRQKPGEAARVVAEEFDIPPDEALRQMKSLIMLNGEEQLSPKYLGRPAGGGPGGLARSIADQAEFLESQRVIRSAPDLPVFEAAVNPAHLGRAMGKR